MPKQTTKKNTSIRNKRKARKMVKKEVKKNVKKELSSQQTKREKRANAKQEEKNKSMTKINNTEKKRNDTAQVRKIIGKMEQNKEAKMQTASHIKASKTKHELSPPSSSSSSSTSIKRTAPKEAKKAVTSSLGAKAKIVKSKRKVAQKLVEVKSKGKQPSNVSVINVKRSVKAKSSISDINNNGVNTTQMPKEEMSQKELLEQEKQKQQQEQEHEVSIHDANNEEKNIDHGVEKTTTSAMQLLPTVVPSHLTSTEADLIARHGKLEEMNVVLQSGEKNGNSETCDSSEIIKAKLNALLNERRVKEEARQRRRSLLTQVQPRDEQVVSRLVASGFNKSSAMFVAIVSRLIKYINTNVNIDGSN